jgi:hypothetical protein
MWSGSFLCQEKLLFKIGVKEKLIDNQKLVLRFLDDVQPLSIASLLFNHTLMVVKWI